MKVFVAGATGAIGRPLVRQLIARGHEVVGTSRSAQNDAQLRAAGATPARASLFVASALAHAMAGCDVVIRTATHIPTAGRRSSEWAMNDRIRREGTQALLEAAATAGVSRYLQESIAWLARPKDGAPFDETSAPQPDAMTQSALDAERSAAGHAIPAASLRLGWIYGSDTAHTQGFANMLRARRLPVVGDGTARFAFIHVEDAAAAFVAAAESALEGVYHVVDDDTSTVGGFFDAFADGLRVRRPMRVPRWLGRIGAGSYVARFLTTPIITSHERFSKATGWRPRFPNAVEAIRLEASDLIAGADRSNSS